MTLALLLLSLATAAPGDAVHQGRLLNTVGTPINGDVAVEVSLFTAQTGGTSLWSQTFANTPVADGYYSLRLPAEALSSSGTWIQLTVEGQVMGARTELASVPSAYRATRADSAATADAVNGDVTATTVVVDGITVIQADGTISYDRLSGASDSPLDGLSCSTSDFIAYNGAEWVCQPRPTRRALGSTPASIAPYSGTPSGWVRIENATAAGWRFSQYNDYLLPGEVTQVRLCLSYSDSGDNSGKVHVRMRRESPSSVRHTFEFGTTWSGSQLVHNDCSSWVDASALSQCTYSFSSQCLIEVSHTQGRAVSIFDGHMEVSAVVP